jgi:Amt family ammonium transporter
MNDIAVQAFLVTHLAAAAGMVAWLVAERMKTGKSTAIGGASGLVAGLVVITPAAGFVDITSSIIMGVLAGVVCFFGIQLKHKLGYDDALDVVGIHGIGGLLGAVLTGVFASPVVNKAMVEPLLETGRMSLIMKQLAAVGGVGLFVFVASLILGKLVDATIGLRVSEASENDGLDSRIHGESGYGFDDALTPAS